MNFTNYFSHDSNAREDEKIIKMRMTHDWYGYGLYWAIIELLRDSSGYKMQTQYSCIAYTLHTSTEIIESIITKFDLFVIENDVFYSKSLIERMLIKEEISVKSKNAANIRWKKYHENQTLNANALLMHSDRNATAMQGKETKETKERKEKEIYKENFSSFEVLKNKIENVLKNKSNKKEETTKDIGHFEEKEKKENLSEECCLQENALEAVLSPDNPEKMECVASTPDVGCKAARIEPETEAEVIPPDVNEVEAYCLERNNGIDAKGFCDYNTARGWMMGKAKMMSWKACVRVWENNNQLGKDNGKNFEKKSFIEF